MNLGDPKPRRSALTMKVALFFYAAVSAAAVLYLWLRGRSPHLVNPSPHGHQIDFTWGIAAGVAVIAVSHLSVKASRKLHDAAELLATALGDVTVARAAVLALLSGVAEELMFRGALQPDLGYVLTSILFGLVHVPPVRQLIPWTVFALLAGFLLGGLYEATGNLLAPFACHFAVNFVNLRALGRTLRDERPPGPDWA